MPFERKSYGRVPSSYGPLPGMCFLGVLVNFFMNLAHTIIITYRERFGRNVEWLVLRKTDEL